MENHAISLNCNSNAERNAYKTLQTISEMYEGRDDYRIIGGQMVNLLLAIYPVENLLPRATQDADTAIEDVELLLLADSELIKAGFERIKGGVFSRGLPGSDSYQEINYIKAEDSAKPHIRPVSIESNGTRVIDATSNLIPVMANPHALRVTAEVIISRDNTFSFSVIIPQIEFAILLKAQAVVDRGYLEKDLTDLLTLFEIQEAHTGAFIWLYSDPNIKGRRKDAVQNLQRISRHLRRNICEGFTGQQTVRLRELIAAHVLPSI